MSYLVGKFFRHYKGQHYYVFNVSTHTETRLQIVNYISLYKTHDLSWGAPWSRPLEMWNELVDGIPRFIEITLPGDEKEETMIEIRKLFVHIY